jgi:hypothetical protein
MLDYPSEKFGFGTSVVALILAGVMALVEGNPAMLVVVSPFAFMCMVVSLV